MREYLLAVAAGLAIGGAWEVGGGTISAFFAAPAPAPSASPAPFKQPTATEYWRLQGECVKLAQNILNGFGGANGPDGRQRSATSHYRADDGHCYAIIYASEIVPRPKVDGKDNGTFDSTSMLLYDGQTGGLLASARTDFDDKQTGMIFDQRYPQIDSHGEHFTSEKALASWDETVSYINSKLGD